MEKQHTASNSVNVTQMVLFGLLVIAAFFVGMLYTKVQVLQNGNTTAKTQVVDTNKAPDTAEPTEPTAVNLDPVTQEDHVKGNRNARYALVEYSDVDCPYCKKFHATAQQMLKEYGDKVMWVYRNFPLEQLHPDAPKKAIAAECVAKLAGNDKYWLFLDELEVTTKTELSEVYNIASRLGLNAAAFKTCVDKNETQSLVEADQQSGAKAGVRGTPGNFLLDTKTGEIVTLPGAVPYSMLKSSLDQLISKAN